MSSSPSATRGDPRAIHITLNITLSLAPNGAPQHVSNTADVDSNVAGIDEKETSPVATIDLTHDQMDRNAQPGPASTQEKTTPPINVSAGSKHRMDFSRVVGLRIPPGKRMRSSPSHDDGENKSTTSDCFGSIKDSIESMAATPYPVMILLKTPGVYRNLLVIAGYHNFKTMTEFSKWFYDESDISAWTYISTLREYRAAGYWHVKPANGLKRIAARREERKETWIPTVSTVPNF